MAKPARRADHLPRRGPEIDVLDVCSELHARGRTILAVLHLRRASSSAPRPADLWRSRATAAPRPPARRDTSRGRTGALMTEQTPAPSTPLQDRSAVKSSDHNRGLVLGTATVRNIADITPELARVVLHIDGLSDEPLWTAPNVAIRFDLDARFEASTRVYTVRSADLAADTIEVDVVRHGAHSPMMQWLQSLRIGDTVSFGGPRPHFPIPEGRSVAIFADATAIPALYAILMQARPDLSGVGWVATGDAAAFAELPELPGLALARIAPGAGFSAQLASIHLHGDLVVWGAGERDEMRAVRSFFRSEHGLAKDDVAVFGYWKRGTTNTQIDEQRLAAYEKLLADGGSLADLDDLALAI